MWLVVVTLVGIPYGFRLTNSAADVDAKSAITNAARE
jgi:hypothetical protein